MVNDDPLSKLVDPLTKAELEAIVSDTKPPTYTPSKKAALGIQAQPESQSKTLLELFGE